MVILVIDGWGISGEIALRWLSLDFTDDKSTLVQVMAWCRQAASHYLSQCWPRSMLPNGVARPQWVNKMIPEYCQMRIAHNLNRPLNIDQTTHPSIILWVRWMTKNFHLLYTLWIRMSDIHIYNLWWRVKWQWLTSQVNGKWTVWSTACSA